eukprot:GFUD01039644.1.p1 GENE.GFUD01039644.1~~GFUD01039644.1.p1  ORF type:complete len:264 (+),score=84.58 GFUD01039644.1:98-889(+)
MDDAEARDLTELAVFCDLCKKVSWEVNYCVHCGHIFDFNLENFPFVQEVLFDQPTGEEAHGLVEDDRHKLESLGTKKVEKMKHVRRREINQCGMYLQEEKEKSSEKLDLKMVLTKWNNMDDNERVKYKERSLEDKAELKKIAEEKGNPCDKKKEKTPEEEEIQKMKMKIKNKKDSEVKRVKREEVKALEMDVCASKKILKSMIVEKKESLKLLNEEIKANNKANESILSELKVSEKLIQVKKETLASVKSEYKTLFSSHYSKK